MAKSYAAFVRESGLKQGDTVRIKRKTTSYANGWQQTWGGTMNQYMGKQGKITSNPNNTSGVTIEGIGGIMWPIFVLEKVLVEGANELIVTAAEVIAWSRNEGVCREWREEIAEEFNVYEADTFEADEDFIRRGYRDANESVRKRLAARFPKTLAEVDFDALGDSEDLIDILENAFENHTSSMLDRAVEGDDSREKAITLLKLIKSTYKL